MVYFLVAKGDGNSEISKGGCKSEIIVININNINGVCNFQHFLPEQNKANAKRVRRENRAP